MPQADDEVFGLSGEDIDQVLAMVDAKQRPFNNTTTTPGVGIVCVAPIGGIAARSGTTITSGSCAVVVRTSSTLSTLGSSSITVWNLSATGAISAGAYIVAVATNIGYVAVWEDC